MSENEDATSTGEEQHYEKEEWETIAGTKLVLTCKSCLAKGTASGGVDHYDGCEVDNGE